ncbi:hypothetical protein BD413DRAFT_625672 [Trametes elegans]|nr:hypothetical protein BD413DRAFT_625672 [Trametes elegans]
MASPPSAPPRYTCEIVFHSATNVPLADLNDLASDPYILATLIPIPPSARGPDSDTPQQSISFRTPTARRTLNPTFNAHWVVSGVPAAGFELVLALRDEDPGDGDDALGKAVVRVPDPQHGTGVQALAAGWHARAREYKVHKRHGGLRARLGTSLAQLVARARVGHRTRVVLSVRVVGPAPRRGGEDGGGRVYTLGPHVFVRHFSPLATHLTAVRSFIANRLQLTGPVPSSLRHRYVGFAPFVKAMFRARGIEGFLLNRALHKQHRAIYKWDANTVWGVVGSEEPHGKKDAQNGDAHHADGDASNPEEVKPDEAFARKFLEMAAYGTEGRIFTYVIMLDGEWRFTETGEEFAIQLLSKHTMHADVAREIAYSGEFFVRRVRTPSKQKPADGATIAGPPPVDDEVDANAELDGYTHESTADARDDDADDDDDDDDPSALPPSAFELVIDNDSGTYRPRAELLPTLAAYLARAENLGALGRVRAMDGFDARLGRWKERRNEAKKRARGGKDKDTRGAVRQASVSSASSSSSREDVVRREAVEGARVDAEEERKREAEGHERKALEDDAQRAKENGDDDPDARKEERDAEKADV